MSSKSFLANLKKKIGEYAFRKLLVIKGHVTLMFAIDNTGSMSKIINAAKNMATAIVTANRTAPVDYILSPFDDPGKHILKHCHLLVGLLAKLLMHFACVFSSRCSQKRIKEFSS